MLSTSEDGSRVRYVFPQERLSLGISYVFAVRSGRKVDDYHDVTSSLSDFVIGFLPVPEPYNLSATKSKDYLQISWETDSDIKRCHLYFGEELYLLRWFLG